MCPKSISICTLLSKLMDVCGFLHLGYFLKWKILSFKNHIYIILLRFSCGKWRFEGKEENSVSNTGFLYFSTCAPSGFLQIGVYTPLCFMGNLDLMGSVACGWWLSMSCEISDLCVEVVDHVISEAINLGKYSWHPTFPPISPQSQTTPHWKQTFLNEP